MVGFSLPCAFSGVTSFSSITFISDWNAMKYCLVVICDGRHVVLPRELAKQVPKSHLMTEDEWRRLGVQQSLGWIHYMIHEPGLCTQPHNDQSHEVSWSLTMAFANCVLNIKVVIGEKMTLFYFSEPHILLFRRPLPKQWQSVTLVSSGTFLWFSVNSGELNHVSGLLWPGCSNRIKGLWEMYFQWKCKGS